MRSWTRPFASWLVVAGLLCLLGSGFACQPPPVAPITRETQSPASAGQTEIPPPPAVSGNPRKPHLIGDREGGDPTSTRTARPAIPQEPSPFRFAEVAEESGINFTHFSGMTEARHFPTANGSGAAFFDADGDGMLDAYYASATLLPLGTATKGPNRFFKNRGGGQFEDATESSGLGYTGFCHGIIVGDIDNDGDQDVFLCNYGSNVLYRNNGDGTFQDVSQSAKIDKSGWSSGGAMLDYDNDGDLDIYVANYGIWRLPEDDVFCGDPESKVRMYCSPRSIRTTKHFLYKNNGDWTFTDVYDNFLVDATGKPIPGRADGHGFAAVAADLDGDGRVDLYISNDMNPNFLYLNQGGGKFEDATETSGAAFDAKGEAQSGMGVDAEDIDGDGNVDLIASNFDHEYNTIHRNLGKASFMDVTPMVGLAADTTPYVGWGLALADFDSDGWPDCFVANGHVDNNREQLGQGTSYAEPSLLHHNVPTRNNQGRRFRLATRDVGPYFDTKHVARGAAFGDYDNDGDVDIAVNHKDGPAALLRNDTPRGDNHWVRLELVGTKSNRDAVGARVHVQVRDRTIERQRKGGGSVFSANDPRLTIGLGNISEITKLTIDWPSGATTTREHLPTDQAFRIVEGE